MFSIFNNKQNGHDLKWLSVDMHSHLLPGINHESLDLEVAVDYIKQLSELGITKIYCTSPILDNKDERFADRLAPAKEQLEAALAQAGVKMDLVQSAKYLVDADFKVTKDLITLPGNCVLLKMSYAEEAPNLTQIILELQKNGYKVVIVNPERYLYYHKSSTSYYKLQELGVSFQLNLMSVMGHYGPAVKKMADHLQAMLFYDLAGTEGHDKRHLDILLMNMREGDMFSKTRSYSFKNKEL